MIKRYGFIVLSLALLSSMSPVLANGCCEAEVKSECTQESTECCKTEETCASCEPCEQSAVKENPEEKLMSATKVDFKVNVRGEESTGNALVIEGLGLSIGNNEMLIQMQVVPVDENNVRIDAMMLTLSAEGTPVAHELISRDAAWGMAADFAWEDDKCPVTMSIVALEKCMVAVTQEVAPQA